MRTCLTLRRAAFMAIVLPALVAAADREEVRSALAAIKSVGPEGAGNAAAARAWRTLARLGPADLPVILSALDDDKPVATNWLRAAVDAVGERALKQKQTLPAAALEAFVLDLHNSTSGRRAAYEWLVRADPSAADRLLPRFVHDPGRELRRDAVARLLDIANKNIAKKDKAAAVTNLREALSGASDRDQVDDIAKQLKGLGVTVDLAQQFGFIRSWHLIAPFDNPKGKNFAVVYPPEKGVDLSATYQGKNGRECRWVPFATTDPYGMVDLNKALGKTKGAIAYARAVIDVPARRRAEFRIGCINALKVFQNGKQLFACEECHHGTDMDQYVIPVTLSAGHNEFLLKVCQDEQTEPWAQEWSFQARLCDAGGAPVPFTVEGGK
jgi:hypothetical protein